ncbi:unnamed protein product [Agarophyton chilense]|eukprot:gb/GEZJ01000813.1/.p2 GENE.gb/GEZJ01000813.1/~~gb/GEZJ01000813.1/.p2  ORF type:complete len:297 (-),score=67.06 gb/GEZJ01000813.1/:3873-4763(-)
MYEGGEVHVRHYTQAELSKNVALAPCLRFLDEVSSSKPFNANQVQFQSTSGHKHFRVGGKSDFNSHSNMCAGELSEYEATTTSDEQIVAEAAESLSTLLKTDEVQSEDISRAVHTLSRLRERLEQSEEEREDLEEQINRHRAIIDNAKSHQERLDHEIIEAKLQSSELLAVRDAIARDLARAKRALEADEETDDQLAASADDLAKSLANGIDLHAHGRPTSSSDIGDTNSSTAVVVDTRDIVEEEDPEMLAKCIAEEMERMNKAEQELLDVVDEVSSLQKRQKEIRQKMKIAQDEW